MVENLQSLLIHSFLKPQLEKSYLTIICNCRTYQSAYGKHSNVVDIQYAHSTHALPIHFTQDGVLLCANQGLEKASNLQTSMAFLITLVFSKINKNLKLLKLTKIACECHTSKICGLLVHHYPRCKAQAEGYGYPIVCFCVCSQNWWLQ